MLNTNEKRLLRNLFQSPVWNVMNKALIVYRKENFFETTAKRETEFDTMWYTAHKEGGKDHLDGFFNNLEQQADE